MAQTKEYPPVERHLKVGWYCYWQHQVYRITAFDSEDALTMEIENAASSERRVVSLVELWLSEGDAEPGLLFAPTLERLHREIENFYPFPGIAPTSGIPETFLAEADRIISVVEQVERLAAKIKQEMDRNGDPYTHTGILRKACALTHPSIVLSTFYQYLRRIHQYHGDRAQIAASFRRTTYHQARLDKSQLHFLDTIIPLFYRADRASRPARVYRLAESALKFHTYGRWIDPNRCPGQVPENLVEELIQVLEKKLPMQAIVDNPEKAGLLTEAGKEVTMPSRGFFYHYLHWFTARPDQGKKVLNDRYGEGTWENRYMVFDVFAHRATFPLQYVFADHYLVDIFTLDKASRRKLSRLWLTVLIDAFSRCILGVALLYEEPCIESIQSALFHAIWPKTSHTLHGIDKEWTCFGIPHQLFLDNAWSHHSHSLENLARQIGHGGKYHTIDLVFRPPYKARYGALIESFFGNLSRRIKQELPGAIQSSDPRHLQKAAKEACLLYEDVDRYVHQFILQYQHTPHSALGGMTPHQKWMEAIQRIGLPDVPPRSQKVRRMFLRLYSGTRVITDKGVSVFGLSYTSAALGAADVIGKEDQKVEYSLRYDPADISTIALYREDRYIDDLTAKELRCTDGTPKATSLWEIKMAKALAKDGGEEEDWLSYLNDAEKLAKTRRAERNRIRRQQKQRMQEGREDDEVERSQIQVEDLSSEDDAYLTQLVADFQS